MSRKEVEAAMPTGVVVGVEEGREEGKTEDEVGST